MHDIFYLHGLMDARRAVLQLKEVFSVAGRHRRRLAARPTHPRRPNLSHDLPMYGNMDSLVEREFVNGVRGWGAGQGWDARATTSTLSPPRLLRSRPVSCTRAQHRIRGRRLACSPSSTPLCTLARSCLKPSSTPSCIRACPLLPTAVEYAVLQLLLILPESSSAAA